MGRATRVLSFSLPPETAKRIESLAKKERCSRSELLREMIKVYEEQLAEKEWRKLFSFGEETAKQFDIKSEKELFEILNKAS